ncbi:ABC transporter ATP-binding protein [Sedimentibacter sp. zth1]|uniref:ABC transporter ATP-binding protein n=1 Tax=Sedimentibacter sp. zth1 TaxID=2816908 RepID=UPI001A91818B|nr:ABC transporter ATP-binding protein [Sedimentibacter sp. zth1]QSX04745.1 ABC transporter ATP-binding protein [Sedimentibacter sp. zth1]
MNNIKKLKTFFSLSWKVSHSYIFILLCNTLISSSQVFINVILPKFLVDELIGNCVVDKLILYGGLIVLSNLFLTFLQNLMKRLLDVKSIYIKNKLNQEMGKKIMNVEYSYLEDPYYLDLKERAVFSINNQGVMESLILSLTSLFKNIFTLIGLAAIMMTLSVVFVLILLVTVAISVFIYMSFANYQVKFFQTIIPVNRKYSVYFETGFNDMYHKDIRLYNMNKMLIDKVTYYNKEINAWFTKFYKKLGQMMGLFAVVNDLQAAIAYGYVGLRVITDKFGAKISIGSFTMYVSSAINFSKSIIELGTNIATVFQNLSYLDPFMEFMSLPNETEQEGKMKFEGSINSIKFENITFSYPKSDKIILSNISFEINKGDKISIVGLNGAGKTTLIKILCRLYKPSSGNVYVNGINIFDYDYDSYMDNIATVFQDYKLLNFSIDENITCNIENSDVDGVMKLIKDVGLEDKIKSLKEGLSTKFGKAYDEKGIEMSGGQSQKIAIARALYKNASLIILDEPTSALDPLAEAEIYENFNSLVGDKTAIYISHRMSSSVFCDKILIIDGGEVKDFDSHANLMKKTDSLYYELFTSQAVNYQV